MVKAREKWSGINFKEADICHQMGLLRVLYAMTLTFTFKVKHLFCYAFSIKNAQSVGRPPADLPLLARPPLWNWCNVVKLQSH